MSRFLLAVAFTVCVVAVPGSEFSGADCAAAGSRPSIVLFLSDDQRFDTLWGMPTVEEALAAHGVTFTNSFVVNPLCCPSRTSLLTSRYSHSTGIYLNEPPHGGFADFRDTTTIATLLHQAGYTTALFGKYLNGYGRDGRGRGYVAPGWDRWSVFYGGMSYYGYRLAEERRIVRYGYDPEDYSTTVLAEQAVSFIEHANRPFFLVLAPYAPHQPATPPPGYGDAFDHFSWWKPPSFNEHDLSDKPAYIQALGPLSPLQVKRAEQFRRRQLEAALGVDDAVRSVLTALGRRHMLATTLLAYTSDNGVAWGEHPLSAARKIVPYEEPIRVPLVIRYDPLTHEQPAENGHLVLNLDLAPTFAELAGTTLPGAQGRNLLALVSGTKRPAWRKDFLIEHLAGSPQRAVPSYCAIRSERYKYILYQTGEEELYDLLRDPHEIDNIAPHPALASLKARLRQRLRVLCRPPPPGYAALHRP